jgi:hypothetical protein
MSLLFLLLDKHFPLSPSLSLSHATFSGLPLPHHHRRVSFNTKQIARVTTLTTPILETTVRHSIQHLSAFKDVDHNTLVQVSIFCLGSSRLAYRSIGQKPRIDEHVHQRCVF